MRADRGDEIVGGEAVVDRLGEQAGRERPEAAFVLARRMGLRGDGADERSDAPLGLDHAGTLERRIDPRDRVGVDAQIDGELPDGRELIARLQPPGRDRRPERALELRVDRRRASAPSLTSERTGPPRDWGAATPPSSGRHLTQALVLLY